jgi:hypothetical protein
LRRAFDGANAEPLGADAITDIDWDNSALVLHPTTQMRDVGWNSAAIWAALDRGSHPPAAAVLSEPTLLLVWRKGLVPQYRSTTGYERLALLQIAGGTGFGAICASVFQDIADDVAVPIIGALFGGWIQDGLIVGAVPAISNSTPNRAADR